MSNVVRVGQEALEPVARTVAASFADDPIWQWIYGVNDTIPIAQGLVLARMLVAQSVPADVTHSAADHGAVALWTAPMVDSADAHEALRDEQAGSYRAAFAEMLSTRMPAVGQLSKAMAEHRPAESHWYLGILGTHPDRQNQGLGGQVLRAMLDETDALGVPTFLESSNPQNYGFYQRHGYVETAELTVDDSPPLLGFWRPAR